MATIDTESTGAELALAFQPPGYEQVPGSTILTRLNYYDGKFLRADDLRLEQDYLRRLVELDARAGGSGLVYGFDVSLGSGDELTIGAGLAFDASGRVLYMPAPFPVGLQKLVDSTRRALATAQQASAGSSSFAVCPPEQAQPAPTGPSGAEFFLITIAHAEEACGEEDVFGKLCDDGCATSTDRAYLVEGVVVRATPFQPTTPFAHSAAIRLTEAHIRSQLVSAYFADEKGFVPCLISKAGLASGAWCSGAAAPAGWEVPIAVVGRLSSSTFVDEWVVRRERMETPPRRYWQGRMCMRPWDVFLAQVLQFQCQLPSVLSGGGGATAVDPCAPHVDVIRQVASYVQDLARAVAEPTTTQPVEAAGAAPVSALALEPLRLETIHALQLRLADVLQNAALPSQHILIDGGLVELPPAGYLPVTPGTTPPVDEQVRRLMGAGVDLRFCIATPDYIPRAFESAQHMDRISLVQGLDNPAAKPKVDVLIPSGALAAAATVPAQGWDATVTLAPPLVAAVAGPQHAVTVATTPPPLVLHGVGRSAVAGAGGEALFAGRQESQPAGAANVPPVAGYASAGCDRNPFVLDAGDTFTLKVEAALAAESEAPFGRTVTATGAFTVDTRGTAAGGGVEVKATGSVSGSGSSLSGGAGSFGPAAVTLAITLEANGSQIVVTPAGGGEAVLTARWAGSPLTVRASVGESDVKGAKAELAAAVLAESADVFSAQNPVNQQAVAALKTLAAVLGDARYTDTVPGKLFDPSGGAAEGTGGVTATLDWVLFHRRREKDCTVVPTVVAPPKTQTYRVFLANAKPNTVATVVKAVESDSQYVVSRYKVHEVGLVEFADASASLATSVQDAGLAWKAADPGTVIAHATVAVETGAAPDALLESRVAAYQDAVQQVSTPAATDRIVVRHPPLTHLPSGPDGQIVFVTTVEVEKVGYEVLAALSDEGAAALKKLVASKNVDAFRGDPQAHPLGTIAFETGTATVADTSLQALAAAMDNHETVMAAYVFTQPGQTTAEDVKSQVEVIMKTLGGTEGANFTLKQYEAKADTPAAGTSLVCVLSVLG